MEDFLDLEPSAFLSLLPTHKISQDQLKSLQLTLSSVTGQNDVHSAYKQLLDLLTEIDSCSDLSTSFKDPSTQTYFFDDFLNETLPYLMSLENISGDGNHIVSICLRQIVRLWSEFLSTHHRQTLNITEIGLDSFMDRFSDIERFSDLLRYTLKEDVLQLEDLKYLWKIIREESSVRDAVYEALPESKNDNLKVAFLDYVILRLTQKSSSKTITADCKLVSRIYEACNTSSLLVLNRYLDFYWQLLSNSPGSIQLCQTLIKELNTLTDKKILTADHTFKMLCDCIESIDKERFTFASLKIRILLGLYPVVATRSQYIHRLCEEHGLLKKVIQELRTFGETPEEKEGKFTQLPEGIQLIAFLTTSFPGCGSIITYEVLSSLWEIVRVYRRDGYVRKIANLIKDIIESVNDIGIKKEDMLKLLEEMKMNHQPNILNIKQEEFECFRSIFVVVNESSQNISKVKLMSKNLQDSMSRFERLKINDGSLEEDGDYQFQVDTVPNRIVGSEILWELASQAEDENAARKARELLVHLYTNLNPELYHFMAKDIRKEYLDLCFECLKEDTNSLRKARCLDLIHAIIDEIDKDCPVRPKSHCELSRGSSLDFSFHYQPGRRQMFKVHQNMLVSDLIDQIKHELPINTAYFSFKKKNDDDASKRISHLQNTRTLQSLGLKDKEGLLIKSSGPPECYLIQYDNTLHPRAKEIFTGWFETYSDLGRMSPQHCADFIHSCTNDECQPYDRRVTDIFGRYDDDKDGYLTLDDFLKLYLECCRTLPNVVWSNLHAHQIANNLKPSNKREQQKETNASLHPSFLISSNSDYVELLFSLLNSEDTVALKALELLNRLPTDPQIFANIVLLKGARDIPDSAKPDWSDILDKDNLYRLSYSLNIIGYLMEPRLFDKDESENVQMLWIQDPKLLEYRETWLTCFMSLGGFEYLQHILKDLELCKPSTIVDICKGHINSIVSEEVR